MTILGALFHRARAMHDADDGTQTHRIKLAVMIPNDLDFFFHSFIPTFASTLNSTHFSEGKSSK